MPSQQDIEAETANVIRDFTEQGHMFTALDVSNEVKNRLPGVRHREVAPIVRDFFASGGFADEYAQTLIQVQLPNGQTAEAFLYHDEADDPDDYAGNQRRQHAKTPAAVRYVPPGQPLPPSMNPAPTPPVQAMSAATSAGSQNGPDTLLLRIAADGSLRVPKSFVEKAVTSAKVHLDRSKATKLYLREDHSTQPDAVLVYDGAELQIPKAELPPSFMPGHVVTATVVGFVIEIF